jgi:hypothetical protein
MQGCRSRPVPLSDANNLMEPRREPGNNGEKGNQKKAPEIAVDEGVLHDQEGYDHDEANDEVMLPP